MIERFIPNPLRKINMALDRKRQQSYRPEYVKLGIEIDPVKIRQEEDSRKLDFRFAFLDRKKEQEQRDKYMNKFPKQVKISSGANQEQIWLAGKEKQAQYYDEPLAPTADQQWFDQDKSEEALENEYLEASTGDILEEEIEFTPEGVDALEENLDESLPQLEFNDVQDSQYCILLDSELVAIVETAQEVEEMVEFMIFSPQTPFEGATLSNISVFKKLALKSGIVLGQ